MCPCVCVCLCLQQAALRTASVRLPGQSTEKKVVCLLSNRISIKSNTHINYLQDDRCDHNSFLVHFLRLFLGSKDSLFQVLSNDIYFGPIPWSACS